MKKIEKGMIIRLFIGIILLILVPFLQRIGYSNNFHITILFTSGFTLFVENLFVLGYYNEELDNNVE